MFSGHIPSRKEVTIVDARMGRGKSTAAIRYMNENKCNKRFLYVAPYLSEVDRICRSCNFIQPEPESDDTSKSAILLGMLHRGANVAITHSLFLLLSDDALALVREKNYSVIIDESPQVVEAVRISKYDTAAVLKMFVDEEENGKLSWRDPSYVGKFDKLKHSADMGSLFRVDSAIISIVDPKIFDAFNEVIVLTYLFSGQYLKLYLDHFGFTYRIVGVEQDAHGYIFSDEPDAPPEIDYSELITIVDNHRMNAIGDDRNALSLNWYKKRGDSNRDIVTLRKHMNNFFRNLSSGKSENRLFTCFKEHFEKLLMSNNRYKDNYLYINARATNEWRNATDVAYMANRFTNPNIGKLLCSAEEGIDEDEFALSEMLQFIWRSAIRDNKPIILYIPSKRMRNLLIKWIEDVKNGEIYV